MLVPPFDLQGGAALAAARGASVVALLSLFGTLLFDALVLPRAIARMSEAEAGVVRRRLGLVAWISLVSCVLGTCAWLAVQSADMADAESLAEAVGAVPTVLAKTVFGHVIAAQLAILLVLAALLPWRRRRVLRWLVPGLAAVAVSAQAGHSHALSMYGGPSLLLGGDILHLLGAGGWLGGLVPLLLVVRAASPGAGATAARYFSPLGQWCIAALVVSAAFQGWVLVASIPGLVGTAYGWMVLLKFALFVVLLGVAAANRYRLAPALLHGQPEIARAVLCRSIQVQTGFALAILVAAVVLSELPPSMHEQKLWPFADQFSLSAVQEDPDIRREVVLACLALAGGLAVLAAAFVARRRRLVATGLAVAIAWFAAPHLDVLLVPAYPTSFYHSPMGFASAGIVEGAADYRQYCAVCHGVNGAGDGPAAKALPVPPANLTAAHLWMHADGELFWWLSHGMKSPEGVQVMPGFAAALSEDQRWATIDYIRANNAGQTRLRTGTWSPPLQAPAFGARCGTDDITLPDLRGRYVRLVIGRAPVDQLAGTVTVVAGGSAPPGVCVTGDENVPAAYAIAAGVAASSLPGTQFLIDDKGWLRAMQQGGWTDARALASEIQRLRTQPVTAATQDVMKMPM